MHQQQSDIISKKHQRSPAISAKPTQESKKILKLQQQPPNYQLRHERSTHFQTAQQQQDQSQLKLGVLFKKVS